jgi:multiple sugar transport system ATP-binding protein
MQQFMPGAGGPSMRRVDKTKTGMLFSMALRFDHLTKKFGDVTAFHIPTLTIEPGEFFTFVGPAKCGKSTLLRVIAGTDEPSTGTLTADTVVFNEVPAAERGVATVLSDGSIKPDSCRYVVFDESTSGMSAAAFRDFVGELKPNGLGDDTTIILATADQGKALEFSDRMAVLDDGAVQQIGTPTEIVDRPKNIVVAGFFGDPPMNVVPGILEKDGVAVEIGPRAVQLNGLVAEDYARDVFLGVRPEHIQLNPDPTAGWRGKVEAIRAQAGQTAIEVHVDGGEFIVQEVGDSSYQVGDRVSIAMPARHLHVFDAHGGRLEVV